MANCAICGKKISVLQQTFPINDERKDLLICATCNVHLNMLSESFDPDYEKIATYFSKVQPHDKYVKEYVKEYLAEVVVSENERTERKKEEESTCEEERRRLSTSLENCMCTTGYNFEGYKIVKYKRLVSGESALGTGFLSELSSSINDFFGTTSTTYESKLSRAKKLAVDKMILCAVEDGANAIIGIDYDVLTLANNMLLVSANGTAVCIEKE